MSSPEFHLTPIAELTGNQTVRARALQPRKAGEDVPRWIRAPGLAEAGNTAKLSRRAQRSRSYPLETRPYFVLGDLVVNIVAGSVIAVITAALFGPSWNMVLAMIVGMALGMLISLPIAILSGALFGAMEVMIPVMTTGMVAGMLVSMAATMGEVAIGWSARVGATTGIGVVIATYVANSVIRRRAGRWTS